MSSGALSIVPVRVQPGRRAPPSRAPTDFFLFFSDTQAGVITGDNVRKLFEHARANKVSASDGRCRATVGGSEHWTDLRNVELCDQLAQTR